MQIAHGLSCRTKQALRPQPHALADEALLKLIAGRDQQALRVLIARHSVRIFRFAMSITNDRSLADEVVSDVFFDVWRHADLFEGRSKVATWLLAIARNKALSCLRRSAHESLNEEVSETIEDTADNPETVLQREQTGRLLAECLSKLPAIHREIIDLVYYHQRSIGEVAEILDIPQSTVKTRMFYARKRIADLLASQKVNVSMH